MSFESHGSEGGLNLIQMARRGGLKWSWFLGQSEVWIKVYSDCFDGFRRHSPIPV